MKQHEKMMLQKSHNLIGKLWDLQEKHKTEKNTYKTHLPINHDPNQRWYSKHIRNAESVQQSPKAGEALRTSILSSSRILNSYSMVSLH